MCYTSQWLAVNSWKSPEEGTSCWNMLWLLNIATWQVLDCNYVVVLAKAYKNEH